jgi:hypothetical protein
MNDFDLEAHELGRQFSKLLRPFLRIAQLNDQIPSLDKARLSQAFPERFHSGRNWRTSRGPKDSNLAYLFTELLCMANNRHSSCASEQRDELATFPLMEIHSMPTSQTRLLRYQIGKVASGGTAGRYGPIFDPAEFAQSLNKRGDPRGVG